MQRVLLYVVRCYRSVIHPFCYQEGHINVISTVKVTDC